VRRFAPDAFFSSRLACLAFMALSEVSPLPVFSLKSVIALAKLFFSLSMKAWYSSKDEASSFSSA